MVPTSRTPRAPHRNAEPKDQQCEHRRKGNCPCVESPCIGKISIGSIFELWTNKSLSWWPDDFCPQMNKLRMKKTTKITLRIQPFMNQHKETFKLWAPVPGYNIAVISVLVFQSSPLNTWRLVGTVGQPFTKNTKTCPQHVQPCRGVPGAQHSKQLSFQESDVVYIYVFLSDLQMIQTESLSEWGDIVASPDTKPRNRSVTSEDLVYCGLLGCCGCCVGLKNWDQNPHEGKQHHHGLQQSTPDHDQQ